MSGSLDRLAESAVAKVALVIDLVLVVGALFFSFEGEALPVSGPRAGVALLAVISWAIAIAVIRLYSPYTPRTFGDRYALSIVAAVAIVAPVGVVDLVLLGPAHGVHELRFFAVLAIGFFATQSLLRLLELRGDDMPGREVLIVGTRALARATADSLRARTRVVGFVRFGDDAVSPRLGGPVLGTDDQLAELLAAHSVDEVYVAEHVIDHGLAMQAAIKTLEEVGMPFAVPAHSMRFNRAQLLDSDAAPDDYLHYLSTTNRPSQMAMKRLLDIVLSAIALVVLSPLLVGVALAIRLTSKGPVLFRQTRVGLHGSVFNFLKFRSMVVDAEAMKDSLLALNERGDGPAFKMKNDPRVTRIGRFLRKFSIDELPQLVNILRGDMSIVGPRPPVPREVEQYLSWQRRRLSVRPGLTCYWQVSGRDHIGFDEWMLLDLRYVDHWSLALDLELILKTFPVVLRGKGAS